MTRGKALNVLNRVEEMLCEGTDLYPCTYGHISCSYVSQGPCSDEAGQVADSYSDEE